MILFPGEESSVLTENFPKFFLLPYWEKPKNNQDQTKKNYSEHFFPKKKIVDKEEEAPGGIFEKEKDEIENEILGETEIRAVSIENWEKKNFLNFFTLRFGQKNFIESVLQNKINLQNKIMCSEKIIGKTFSKNFSENIVALGGENGFISLFRVGKNFYENSTKILNEVNRVPIKKKNTMELKKENSEKFSKDGPVNCLSWNKILSNFLISATQKGVIRCWDIKEGKKLFERKNFESGISCLEWSPVVKTEFLFLKGDSVISFSDIRCRNIIQTQVSQKSIHSVHWTGHDNMIMVGEKKGKIGIYDKRKFDENLEASKIFSFRGIKEDIKKFLFSPKRRNFLLVGKKGKIETWNYLDPMKFRRTSPVNVFSSPKDQFDWIEVNQVEKVINLRWKKGFFLIN